MDAYGNVTPAGEYGGAAVRQIEFELSQQETDALEAYMENQPGFYPSGLRRVFSEILILRTFLDEAQQQLEESDVINGILKDELQQTQEELAMYQRHVYHGMPPENLRRFYRDVDQELTRAMERYPRMNSAHEAYAVILEELEELWQEIKVKQAHHDHAAMRKEAVQIAAMVARFVVDVLELQK
jgi:hypothetical protein